MFVVAAVKAVVIAVEGAAIINRGVPMRGWVQIQPLIFFPSPSFAISPKFDYFRTETSLNHCNSPQKSKQAVYSCLYVAGLALAAFGFLPPVLAAAAQSLPDLGILANSARLLRQK